MADPDLELGMSEIEPFGAFLADTEPMGAEILRSDKEQLEADIFRVAPELFDLMEKLFKIVYPL